jgi:hypothetical protein
VAVTTTVWFAGPNRVQSSTSASTSDDEGTFEVGLFKPISNPGIDDSALWFPLLVIFNPKENLFFLIEGDGRGNSSRFGILKSGGESNVVDLARERVIGVDGVLRRSKENG